MKMLPTVSVIMPVRNEGKFISRSLSAVLNQDYPADRVEVIVADGMSNDGTREVIESLTAKHPCLRLVDNPGGIVPTGLNAAIARANGEIIVRVDGHCEIARDYVRRAVDHLLKDGIDGVGGPLDTLGETPVAKVIALAMSSSFGVGGSAFRTTHNTTMLTDTVAFPAYTRAILDRAGPFDEELVRNQDDEYNYRLRKLGAKLLLAADVHATYYSRSSLRSLWRQYFQYGYWKVRVLQKHPLQMRLRQFAPAVFVTSLIISLLLMPFYLIGKLGFLFVAGAYLMANLVASTLGFGKTAKGELKTLPLLGVCFGILHIAYGLGFLTGLIKFWNRWGDKKTRTNLAKQVHSSFQGID
jgi:glycosyltransferase involved in cell wall biosynthesis